MGYAEMILASAKFRTAEAHGWCYGQGRTEADARAELTEAMALRGRTAVGEITIREVPGETVPMEPLTVEPVEVVRTAVVVAAVPAPKAKSVDRKAAAYEAFLTARKAA